jgi:RNA polymerase primary sigma factor
MRQLVITKSITRRDQKSLQRYLNDIAQHDILTPDQELELFKRYRNGDDQAFNEIITRNLRFVVSVAKKYQNVGMWLGDLINEGNIGLIKAAQRFDETKGL